MRILTADQIRKVEALAFERYFTEEQLMLRAGTACFNKMVKHYGKELQNASAAVVCGNGKNAGDGFVIAKLLHEYGADAYIVLADKPPELETPKKFFDEAAESGVKVVKFSAFSGSPRFIVDCLFGIGFHGVPKAPFDRVITKINSSAAAVISIDTPSGTNSTTGEAETAVKADLTIAISTLKYAHILPPANAFCGRTVTVNIGIPRDCYEEQYLNTIEKQKIRKNFIPRDVNANKGTYGHQLNICGSCRMPGAAVLCAQGALKTGVGLLKCLFPKSVYPVLTAHLIQPLFLPVCENQEKTLSMGAMTDVLEQLKWADSVVIGCGLGNNDDTQVIVNQVLKESVKPVILDADGINCILPFIDILEDRKAPLILTPHPGEMARLIGESVQTVQQNRIRTAKEFAARYSIIVVLKGANTIVTDGRQVFVNTTGNPGMAMGGTGDLLAGMIGSFAAQGFDPFEAAKSAVYIHGLCGDITAGEISQRGMTAEDMISLLGALMSEFE